MFNKIFGLAKMWMYPGSRAQQGSQIQKSAKPDETTQGGEPKDKIEEETERRERYKMRFANSDRANNAMNPWAKRGLSHKRDDEDIHEGAPGG